MPYSKADFDTVKQSKYKAAIAAASLTDAANVDIVSVTDMKALRRAAHTAGSIDVETKVIALRLIFCRSEDLITALSGESKKMEVDQWLRPRSLTCCLQIYTTVVCMSEHSGSSAINSTTSSAINSTGRLYVRAFWE